MIRTGGSLINAAKSYREAGASRIFAITTHGLFNNNALARLQASQLFAKVFCTNTYPNTQTFGQNPLLEVKSVAKIIHKKLLNS
jgi:ribose-phosphate pyrophosphokinase